MSVFESVCLCFTLWWSSHLEWISTEALLAFMGLFTLMVLKTDTVLTKHTAAHSFFMSVCVYTQTMCFLKVAFNGNISSFKEIGLIITECKTGIKANTLASRVQL